MGMGAIPSNTFNNFKRRLNGLNTSTSSFDSSSATSTYLHEKVARLESQLEGTLTALKDYMISKEGGVPEEFVDLFAPQPHVRTSGISNLCYMFPPLSFHLVWLNY